VKIASHLLVDLLDLANKLLMGELKRSIEKVFEANVTAQSYLDTYMVAQGFDCSELKDYLISWGRQNLQDLRRERVVGELDRKD
jgi:hypothetical protein